MPSPTKIAAAAGSKVRVQGVTGDQVVKSSSAILQRILVSNANGAAQTLTVKDGAATLIVLQIPATTTPTPFEFGVYMGTSIVVTPSHAGVDALVMFD